MSTYDTVNVERRDNIAIVSMNRPDSLNAFNSELRRDILLAVREVNADEDIRIVILTGQGRAFSAGADLAETPSDGANFRVEDQLNGEFKPPLLEIAEAPKPWISAVNGAAAGIGSAFAMVCDLTVMAENAYVYQAFTSISLVPDGGATWHLVRTLGRKRAYELIASARKVPAQECMELGLCNRVVPADLLLEEAVSWAQELAEQAPLSLRYAKQAVNEAMENSLDRTISNEAKLQHLCISSEDSKEGVLAFLQKRAPQWKGR